VLDLGTGGGERFVRYAPFPRVAIVPEAHLPNVPVAAARLAPLGVQVIGTDQNCHQSAGPQPGNRWPERRLPFADDASTSFWPATALSVRSRSPVSCARVGYC
jgi:hypothetical protein